MTAPFLYVCNNSNLQIFVARLSRSGLGGGARRVGAGGGSRQRTAQNTESEVAGLKVQLGPLRNNAVAVSIS